MFNAINSPRFRHKTAALIFFAIMIIPGTVQLFDTRSDNEIAQIENRAAAPWPAAPKSLNELNGYARRVDAFIADHFGLRVLLIYLNNKLVDEAGLRPADRSVIIGKDGWLFYAGGKTLEMHMGRMPFREGELADWIATVERLDEDVRAKGGTFAVMLAPQKASVYSRFMPDFAPEGNNISRLELLNEAAKTTGIPVVDVLTPFREYDGNKRLYYRADTHWNARGAWIAYCTLIDTLRGAGVEIDALDSSLVTFGEKEFQGDLARMLGQQEKYTQPETYAVITDAVASQKTESDRFAFDGIKSQTITTGEIDKPTLLILGDSFSFALIPYLRESFREVTIVHHRLGQIDPEILEVYPADIVLLEMTERFLVEPLCYPARADSE